MKDTRLTDTSVIFQNKVFDYSNGKLKGRIITPNYNIVQVTDSFYLRSFTISPHKQECDVEITYVAYNQMDSFTDNVKDVVHHSDLYISLRNDIHHLKSATHCSFITVAFDFKSKSQFKPLLNDIIAKYQNPNNRQVKNPKIGELFTKIVNELHNIDEEYTKFQLDALITTVILTLLTAKNDESNNMFDERENFVPRLLNYIDKHYLEIHNLQEVSNHFGYSYNYVYKIFKKHTNQTLQEYIVNKKMEKAKTLIEEGLTVAKISEILGYSSAYNFSRSFKTFYKTSPIKYKETLTKK
jgi:AraC-like DNA-binding protein